MIETYMLFNFLIFVAVTIPLVVADGMLVTYLRERYPEAWEDLGKPGFLVDPKTSQKIRSFAKRGGDHPMLQDPNVKRLAATMNVLAPVQTLLFVTFAILFVWLLIS
jgi:hypothetical protein